MPSEVERDGIREGDADAAAADGRLWAIGVVVSRSRKVLGRALVVRPHQMLWERLLPGQTLGAFVVAVVFSACASNQPQLERATLAGKCWVEQSIKIEEEWNADDRSLDNLSGALRREGLQNQSRDYFPAKGKTITRLASEHGVPAIQLEINATWLTPSLGPDATHRYAELLQGLLRFLMTRYHLKNLADCPSGV